MQCSKLFEIRYIGKLKTLVKYQRIHYSLYSYNRKHHNITCGGQSVASLRMVTPGAEFRGVTLHDV